PRYRQCGGTTSTPSADDYNVSGALPGRLGAAGHGSRKGRRSQGGQLEKTAAVHGASPGTFSIVSRQRSEPPRLEYTWMPGVVMDGGRQLICLGRANLLPSSLFLGRADFHEEVPICASPRPRLVDEPIESDKSTG